MDTVDLLKLIEDDELGLLNVKSKKSSMLTTDERLIVSFHEINDFVSKNGREPVHGNEISEHHLNMPGVICLLCQMK